MILFQEKFKEEVKEYFERLESGLLLLEQDSENFQVIEEIFRIMHSMKGSGGMFGFDLLSDVTHDLESLYDIFRTKKMQINSAVISFTLKSIDGLHNLLTQDPSEEHQLLAQKMKIETRQLIDSLYKSDIEIKEDVGLNEKKTVSKIHEPNQNTYYITFKPNENIFDNGTNPLYLIDETYQQKGDFNVIFLRNTLIYFEPAVQFKILTKVLDKLVDGGFLFIGHSESLINMNLPIRSIAPSVYVKKI